MIDIHCHILPFADDGADSMEDALEMARMAVDSGVDAMIATPHFHISDTEEHNVKSARLAQHFLQLRERVEQAGIPLSLYFGAEILCTTDVPDLLKNNQPVTLAGSNYLLVEFFFDEDLAYMDDMLSAIAAQGLTPVIAHPERYEAVQNTPYIIERWFADGYIIQVNKGSILGRLGRRAAATANWILARGLAHAVASDAHSSVVRTPRMGQLRDHLAMHYSPDYAHILLEHNPLCILKNEPVLSAD